MIGEPAAGLAGSPWMHRLTPFLLTLPLLLTAGCDRSPRNSSDQPGVVANIMDQTLPDARDVAQDNGIHPVETTPPIDPPAPAAGPAPDGAIPIAMQGRWTGAADQCGDRSAALELTVTPDQLLFHESVGTVDKVSPGADDRAVVDAAFTGEGQSWTRRLTLRISKDGKALTITNDGTAVTRKRC